MHRRWATTISVMFAVGATTLSRADAARPPFGVTCTTPVLGTGDGPFSFGDLVFFGFKSAVLSVRASHILDETVRYAVCNHFRSLVIEAHEDGAEKTSGAACLDRRRAETVRDYFIRQGLPRSMLIVLTRGDAEPLVSTAQGASEPQNRFVRIEFR